MATPTLLFGGHGDTPQVAPDHGSFGALCEWLSWKYVTPDATFAVSQDLDRRKADDPAEHRSNMSRRAAKVWSQLNEMPTGAEVHAFDLMALEPEFRQWIARHGQGIFDRGLSVDEIWTSQQLFSVKQFRVILSENMRTSPRRE